jgi:tripartite-type tricarboxylate transporter receptor subunit TctC
LSEITFDRRDRIRALQMEASVRFRRRKFLRLAAGAIALTAVPRASIAQAWPTRVVRLVVGFPPGGGADAAARIVANRLSEIWGQSVVIENRSGAGGNIAMDAVAHASPDGYTMAQSVIPPAVYGFLLGSLTYDPIADLAPVTVIGTYPNILAVAKSSPIKSVQDYIDNAKASPGKITFASPGVGTTAHLAGELFKHMAGIDITHVPYRGVAAGGMTDLIAGRIDAMFNTTGSLLQAVKSGQVRGLGITSSQRLAAAPELPAIAETVSGYAVTAWYGIYVPAKTPVPIVQKMHDDIVAALGDTEVKRRFEPLGVAVGGSTPTEMAARARADTDLWGPIIKAANIRGE